MSKFSTLAIIDIGKTNAKVVLFDVARKIEFAERRITNRVVHADPYPHYDSEGLWIFICTALAEFYQTHGFDAISITTHGASIALLDENGQLALPILDYEHSYPQDVTQAYSLIRPSFPETYSPSLSGGLNVGAQLHYQKALFPKAFANVRTILTYPQYWAFRLTGIAVNEVTSLGCHTDLWQPRERAYSALVDTLDIREVMAPLHSAFDCVGTMTTDLADALKINDNIPVYSGIHDSNASLLPHLIVRKAPFSVVSSGTWLIHFAAGGAFEQLDEKRDTLANVDAYGNAIPSSRFMGGREFEILTEMLGPLREIDAEAEIDRVIARKTMLLPNLTTGSGPFSALSHRWVNAEGSSNHAKWAAACLYLALMTETCLSLIGAKGDIIVEGPFAKNKLFIQLLSCIARRPVIAMQNATGTSLGAAILTGAISVKSENSVSPPPPPPTYDLDAYCGKWNELVSGAKSYATLNA